MGCVNLNQVSKIELRCSLPGYRDISLVDVMLAVADINKFLWMVRIGGSTDRGRHIKEADYYTPQGEFRVDKEGSPTLLNCLMYKMCYYRFGSVYTEQGRRTLYDSLFPPLRSFSRCTSISRSPLVSFFHLFRYRTFGNMWHRFFYRLDARPVTHPAVLKHWQQLGPSTRVSPVVCSYLFFICLPTSNTISIPPGGWQ